MNAQFLNQNGIYLPEQKNEHYKTRVKNASKAYDKAMEHWERINYHPSVDDLYRLKIQIAKIKR